MTAKQLRLLAALVNDIATNGGSCGAEWLAHHLADICANTNPRFDRDRFLAACYANSRFPTKTPAAWKALA